MEFNTAIFKTFFLARISSNISVFSITKTIFEIFETINQTTPNKKVKEIIFNGKFKFRTFYLFYALINS